jgi:hypothetical protein
MQFLGTIFSNPNHPYGDRNDENKTKKIQDVPFGFRQWEMKGANLHKTFFWW